MAERKRLTEEQILTILGQIDAVASMLRFRMAHGISDRPIYKRREHYAEMSKCELASSS